MTATAPLHSLYAKLADLDLGQRFGLVRRVRGLSIEASGPKLALGSVCEIRSGPGIPNQIAEVVSISEDSTTLMPYGDLRGIRTGARVLPRSDKPSLKASPALLGRVIDAFGQPLDGHPLNLGNATEQAIYASAVPALSRPRIQRPLETGVRVIDHLLTLGLGQRVGIFAGSGVGKSTLLGMIARHVASQQQLKTINIVVLVGERGREVKEFIDKQFNAQTLSRSIMVVATADQPALQRIRAVYAGLALAEYFRDQGHQVLLTIDSMTRFAMARREVGLFVGEPPTSRGYTPSVFAELPAICERCGTAPSGGSITALFTVLVEGDDFNEPISDHLRAILDGHIVLSRQIANQGIFPAIDVLNSSSRCMPDIVHAEQLDTAQTVIKTLEILKRYRNMLDIGAYQPGSNAELDLALEREAGLQQWRAQGQQATAFNLGFKQLMQTINSSRASA